MANETKVCDNCDATIAKDEKVCPACKCDLDKLEESLKELETLQNVKAKRDKKKATPPVTEPAPRKSLFGGLIKR